MRLEHDNHLADLLHRNPNFEEALTELQTEAATSARPGVPERLQRLEMAIIDAFAVMNRNLGAASFNFCAEGEYALPEFLVLFDGIFTLNQDLLLEKHYLTHRRSSLSRAPGDGSAPVCQPLTKYQIPRGPDYMTR
jgi:hypothetical protein